MVGNATKASDTLMNHDKKYKFGISFGKVTDTGDITGKVIEQNKAELSIDSVKQCAYSFVGKQSQVPPMYSALKVDGKKLYELAREGKTIERKAREIEIYSMEFVCRVNDTDFIFEVECSKGTYIRTLCEDIGNKMGCGATMFSLERQKSGQYDISKCYTLEEIEQSGDKNSFLKPVESVFEKYPVVKLDGFYCTLCKNGAEIYLEKAGIDKKIFSQNPLCRLYDSEGRFFAVGEMKNYPDGEAVKATIRFDT
jgi:tRNA pseudouridine55 synthase